MEVLYEHLKKNFESLDLSDILRAQQVYAVSALDKLIHELVRIGMLHSFLGVRVKTSKFNNFPISLETHLKIQEIQKQSSLLSLETPEYFFEQEIIVKHKHLSFQDPEKIADALSFIWEEKQKWQKIANHLALSEDVVKKTLKNIVSRRNQIVHEADIDLQTDSRNIIEASDVKYSVEFIDKLGLSIFELVSKAKLV